MTSIVKQIARGYTRVSTTGQSEDGVSLETQKVRIKAYCEYRNLNLVEFYTDAGISAKDMENRPELQRLLKEVRKEEFVIITDISRLSRNTKDAITILEDFKEKKISLVSLDIGLDFSTSAGTLVFTLLCSVAKMERENISRSVKVNLQRLSKEGKLRARPPFGYKFVSKEEDYEQVPEQQLVIEKIKTLFREDPCLSRIAERLNKDGDNKTIALNKKEQKEYQFTRHLVEIILVDNGVLAPSKRLEGRKSLQEQIKSHHSE